MSLSIAKLFGLEGKVALVTGGGRGIGKMIAQGFVENGVKVYICSRSKEACEKTAQELTSLGRGECIPLAEDLSTEDGCKRLAEVIKKRENKLNILVNNSGTSWGEPLEKFTDKGWEKVIALNLKAPFFLTRDLLPLLDAGSQEQDPARVIMIGSIAGIRPQVFPTYSYDVSKIGVHHLTVKLAHDLARRNGGNGKTSITVNAIAPGFVPSKMSAQLLTYAGKEEIEATIPLGRLGSPGDMAGAAIYLSSRAASWVTGAIIPVDGGAVTEPVAGGPSSKL